VDTDEFLATVKVITEKERAKRVAKAESEAAEQAERAAEQAERAATRTTTRRESAAQAPSPFGNQQVSALDQVYRLLKEYVDMKEHEYVAVALWCLHTHVYAFYTHTPRLAFMSPEPGAGKSTAFDIINQFCASSEIIGNITGPALFRTINTTTGALLLDEGDNLKWDDRSLRAVINDGHQPGRPIKRTIANVAVSFDTFAPLGLAAIGKFPVPLMQRAIVINMAPPLPTVAVKLKKFSVLTSFDYTWAAITTWAETPPLNFDPPLPPGMILRIADNWRPLISIADSFGPSWGALARKSALAFQSLTSDSIAKLLLYDIRSIFNRESLDLIGSDSLVRNLLNREDNWTWSAYQGTADDKTARKLSTGEVSRLLRPFGITPRSIWTAGPRASASSFKGYRREQFEETWAKWCPEPSRARRSQTADVLLFPNDAA
jgi:hypothetical protein